MKKEKILGLLLLIVITVGCNNVGKPKNFDYGRVENNKYFNSFFDLEITLPDNWVVQTKEQVENLNKMGQKIVAGDDKNLKAAMDASDINSANLLTVTQYEVGAAVESNSSFVLTADNLKNTPGIKTGSDYLFHLRKQLKLGQIQFDYIEEEFKKIEISNHKFYIMNASLSFNGKNIKYVFYSSIQNGFCFFMTIVFENEEQKGILEKIVNSVKFKN